MDLLYLNTTHACIYMANIYNHNYSFAFLLSVCDSEWWHELKFNLNTVRPKIFARGFCARDLG